MAAQPHLLPIFCRVGIDPGLTGTIAVVNDDGVMMVLDMPTVQPHGKARTVDYVTLAMWAKHIAVEYGRPNVYVENQRAMGGAGGRGASGASMFSLGRSFGRTESAVMSADLAITYVEPASWKRRAGLIKHPRGKIAAIHVAKQIFPNLYKHLGGNTERNIARCEACLIAYFGEKTK